jgi:hypothetical protein
MQLQLINHDNVLYSTFILLTILQLISFKLSREYKRQSVFVKRKITPPPFSSPVPSPLPTNSFNNTSIKTSSTSNSPSHS